MLAPRWRKVLGDLWSNKTRTLLVVLAIAIGVFAIGMVSGGRAILMRDLNGDWNATNPASASIAANDIDDALVQTIRRMPGVADAQATRGVTVRALTPTGEWKDLQLQERERLPGELPQEFRDREAAAQRAVEDGETALAQAHLTLEQARQAEITGIQAAETSVRDAEARYERLVSPAEADAIAAARAQIAAAEARLARLTGGERAGNVSAAEAGVRNAEARLAELQAAPSDATLSGAAARVRGAEVALKQARLALERATLNAPMAGTVAELNLKIGEVASPTTPAVVLADMSAWQIETEDLTELSVVQIREGDPARITFDALPGFELPGVVERIKPLGKNRQGDIVYTIVVKPTTWDERLRWNMTASVQIGG